jgi:hypothetical protein
MATNNAAGGLIQGGSGFLGSYKNNESVNNNGVADSAVTTVTPN